jgi:hypothetical protein
MTSFIIKNRILKELAKNGTKGSHSEHISTNLNIEHYVVYALLTEMRTRDHVKNSSTATVNHAFSYHTSITPQGQYFIDKGGYTFEWVKTFIVDFPKNFWWLIAILSYFIGKGFNSN